VTAREDIAAAASTVDGIEVFPEYEHVTTPGQGYVTWLRTEYPNTLGGEDYWGIVITLPPDTAAAQAWVAENLQPLWKALRKSRAMTVTGARPDVDLPTDNQAQKVLIVEGHRESEE
jgi:hypothetical protein